MRQPRDQVKSVKENLLLHNEAVYEALDGIQTALDRDDWGEVKNALGCIEAAGVAGKLFIDMLERKGFITVVEPKVEIRYGMKP